MGHYRLWMCNFQLIIDHLTFITRPKRQAICFPLPCLHATQIILHLILHPIAFPNSVGLRMTASDISDQLSK